jgi:hypothetical protein
MYGLPWCDKNYEKYSPRRNQLPAVSPDSIRLPQGYQNNPDIVPNPYDPVTNKESFLPTDNPDVLGLGGEFIAGLPDSSGSNPGDFVGTEAAGTGQVTVALSPDNSNLGAGEFIIPDNPAASTDGTFQLALGPEPNLTNPDSFGSAELGGTGSELTAFAPESTENNQFDFNTLPNDSAQVATLGGISFDGGAVTNSGSDFTAFAPVDENSNSFVANAGSSPDYEGFIS